MKKLYLIPSPISDDLTYIPRSTVEVINRSNRFICERIRTTRRYIKAVLPEFDIDHAEFLELDKNATLLEQGEILNWLGEGKDIALLSESGLPCIADPGATLVVQARRNGYEIVPLTGPSSILLTLMASGLTGQNFTFRGYLPVKKNQLARELKNVERQIKQTGYTQIFIETPYRNLSLYNEIISQISENLILSIGYNIYTRHQYFDGKSIKEWKIDNDIRELLSKKVPVVFILGR